MSSPEESPSVSPPANPIPSMSRSIPEWNTESYNALQENGFISTANDPLSTFSIDVDTASYSNVRRFINEGKLPPKGAVRIEELINYFSYDYPQPDGEHPFSVTTEVGPCPWNDSRKLVRIGLKAKILTKRSPAVESGLSDRRFRFHVRAQQTSSPAKVHENAGQTTG